MEAPHDDPSHLDWSLWDDNYSEEDFVDWSLVNLEGQTTLANSTVPSSFQNDAAPLEGLPVTPDLALNYLGLDLGNMEPLDYISNMDAPPDLVPSFMSEGVSPTNSGDVWTPTSGASSGASTGESAFTGSSLASNTPCFSPDFFLPQSPQTCYINQLHNPTIDAPQLLTITYTYQQPAFTMPEAQERSPSQTTPATTDEADQMQKKPPGTRAREWRKQMKPVPCKECPERYAFKSDLDKHIVVHHPDKAAQYDLSTERSFCTWCDKSYSRPSGLARHLIKHGRLKGTRTRRKK